MPLYHREENMENFMDQMKKVLPEYICNCLEVTGFDTEDAISEMDDNAITEIEQYIDKRKASLPFCMRQNLHYTCDVTAMPFEFPPGHHILIKKFISSVQASVLKKNVTARSKQKPAPPLKKRKVVLPPIVPETEPQILSEIISDTTNETKETILNDIRCKVLKWKKSYNKGELADMKEGDDFIIVVNESMSNPSTYDSSIQCKCGKSYAMVTG